MLRKGVVARLSTCSSDSLYCRDHIACVAWNVTNLDVAGTDFGRSVVRGWAWLLNFDKAPAPSEAVTPPAPN